MYVCYGIPCFGDFIGCSWRVSRFGIGRDSFGGFRLGFSGCLASEDLGLLAFG